MEWKGAEALRKMCESGFVLRLAKLAWQVAAAMPLLERGEFAAALPPLEQACQRGETNGCYLWGRALLSLDRYLPAREVLMQARRRDEFPWRVDDALGLVAEALGEAAEALFLAAVKGNGNSSAEPRLHYGQYLMRQGRAAEALMPLASGAKQFPAHGLLRFEYGRALYQLDRLAEAEAELAAAGTEAAKALLAKVRRQRASGRL